MSEPEIENQQSSMSEFEQSLAKLKPRPYLVSRDEIMYEAGRQAGLQVVTTAASSPMKIWPLATAASWIVTLTLLTLMFQPNVNSQPMIVEEPVHIREQPQETVNDTESLATSSQSVQQPLPDFSTSSFARDLFPAIGELTPVAFMRWQRGNDLDEATHVSLHRNRRDLPPPTYAHLSAEMLDFTGDGSL